MRMIKSGVLDEKKYYCDGRKKWEKRGKKSEEDENDERMEKSEIGKEESEELGGRKAGLWGEVREDDSR